MSYPKDKTKQMTKQKREHSKKRLETCRENVEKENSKKKKNGGKTGDKRRQKTKTAGFSVLRVIYESVFCLNELLQQLRGKRGRACVRRVQRGRDHVTLTRCNVLKNR